MIDNRSLLRELLDTGRIRLRDDAFLESDPPALAQPLDRDRLEGMLLGLAVGDALGNTSESMLPSQRRKTHGEIRDYLPHPFANGRPVGLPSDDTQMASWTLEQLLADGGLIPDHLARRFCREPIFGIGQSVQAFRWRYTDEELPWDRAGVPSAGNGALMRIAPVLLPHANNATPALWADTALAAMVTHNDAGPTAACVVFVHLLWQTLRLRECPPRGWWVETFCGVAKRLEGDTGYRTSPGVSHTYRGALWAFTERVVTDALDRELAVVEACAGWYSEAYLLETLPSVLYSLEACGHDPEEAIVRAVNDTWDNDTVAAIVGAAVGALHGKAALPSRWLEALLGRKGARDDGQVTQVLASVLARCMGKHSHLKTRTP